MAGPSGWDRNAAGFTLFLVGAAAIVASANAWLVYVAAFRDGVRYNAVGADWMVFHSAARLFLDGRLETIFDGGRLTAYLNRTYQAWLPMTIVYRPWVYPPSYLLLVAPFGFLGFVASYVSFQLVTAAALVAALTVGAGKDARAACLIAAAALLSPAAVDNFGAGQNAFLIAALLIAGFRLLNRRPVFAGLILGVLTIKPQFALMAPIALIAARQWPALLAAAGSALLLALVSALIFGVDPWAIWLSQAMSSLAASDLQWTRFGRMWGDSVWTCAILLGAAPAAASLAQLAATVWAAGAVAVAWRRPLSEGSKLAVLLAATLLAAPYWSSYDAILLALAGLFLLAEAPRNGDLWAWVLALALWLAPVASPPVQTPIGRLIPIAIAAFIAFALWPQRWRATVSAAAGEPRPAQSV